MKALPITFAIDDLPADRQIPFIRKKGFFQESSLLATLMEERIDKKKREVHFFSDLKILFHSRLKERIMEPTN